MEIDLGQKQEKVEKILQGEASGLGEESGQDSTKLRHNDSIGKALSKLVKKLIIEATHKQFRSTSADLLFKQKQYRACLFHELFLGHSIKRITGQSYVSNDDTTLDDAISLLGEQFGIK